MSGDTTLDRLEQHPRVCNTCFRLRHDEDPKPEWIQQKALRTHWAAAVTDAWTRTEHAESVALPGDTISEWRPSTVCACGSKSAYDCRWEGEPLDFGTLIGYTDNLSKTLDELAIAAHDRGNDRKRERFHHDRDVLFRCVRHLKSMPERQFADGQILAAATEVAVRHAPENHDERPPRQSLPDAGDRADNRERVPADD